MSEIDAAEEGEVSEGSTLLIALQILMYTTFGVGLIALLVVFLLTPLR